MALYQEDSAPSDSTDQFITAVKTAGGNKGAYVAQATIPPNYGPRMEDVKAIHLAYGTYFSESFEQILEEIKNSDVNTIVFEIKEPNGYIAVNRESHTEVLKEILPELEKEGIHTVARMVVFEDTILTNSRPDLAIYNVNTGGIWRDYKGVGWADPTNTEVWNYNIDIAKKALDLGFREINFDYIRFPSDGPIRAARYDNLEKYGERTDAIGAFLEFARKELGQNAIISIDVFGMTFINDQLVIGQALSKMGPHVDVIYPMPYPSHYPDGFRGFANPADHPYEIIYYTLKRGKEKLGDSDAVIRPWLQDFDLGAYYGPNEIRAQIKAANDLGIDSWALWNAANRYTWSAVK